MKNHRETPFRYESKYCPTTYSLEKIKDVLVSNSFIRSYPTRTVCSLYFDTIWFKSISETLAGQSFRNKFRLRWYIPQNDEEMVSVSLEKKIKSSNIGHKKIYDLGLFPANMTVSALSSKCVRSINTYIDLQLSFVDMFPQHLTTYRREYLQDDAGIRATVDTNLTFSDDFTSAIIDSNPRRFFYDPIVELKCPVPLHDRLAQIRCALPVPSVRCSKYVLGQSLLRNFSYL